MCKIALTTMLKTVGQLDNLRRAPGPQGHLKKVPGPAGIPMHMTADESMFTPYPATMKIQWDGELPPLLGKGAW
jgi:linoleate 8R-lipoxygenase/9,12-octadecadienoate 8-hydroperoxide 8R-isomerase